MSLLEIMIMWLYLRKITLKERLTLIIEEVWRNLQIDQEFSIQKDEEFLNILESLKYLKTILQKCSRTRKFTSKRWKIFFDEKSMQASCIKFTNQN